MSLCYTCDAYREIKQEDGRIFSLCSVLHVQGRAINVDFKQVAECPYYYSIEKDIAVATERAQEKAEKEKKGGIKNLLRGLF